MCEEHSVLVACVRVFVFRCKSVFVCHNALVGASCPSQVIAWPATWGMVRVSHLGPQTPPPPSLSSPHNLVFDYKLQFLFVISCCWGASLIWVGQELYLRIGEWLGLLPAHSLTLTISDHHQTNRPRPEYLLIMCLSQLLGDGCNLPVGLWVLKGAGKFGDKWSVSLLGSAGV